MAVETTLSETDLKLSGIRALNKALGRDGALRFLSLVGRDPTDYVLISRDLYEGQTVDGIYHRAQGNWRKRRSP